MCGILGGNNKMWNYEKGLSLIQHRGPDSQRICKVKNLYMGFARLSIIDLDEKAMQPMFSEDNRYVIVFNGEIYDYQKIKKQLEKKGHTFYTYSDTEVLLHSFIEWKEKMMNYIDGIFAFVIYDTWEERIYLFRDRCGVKPLYYFFDGKNFAFASELKVIKEMCIDISFEIDNTALYDYHNYLYIPEPKTMYKKVHKLPSASYLYFDVKNQHISKIKRYWKVKVNPKEGNILTQKQLDLKAEELRYHLNNVILRQIVSDVPVGTFLSGGVDSSIITATTKQHIQDVTAYAIGFDDSRYDESKYAKQVAEILDVNFILKKFRKQDFDKLYKKLPDFYDEPFADTSAYPTYFVSKLAKQDVTVVLTGDGGDELFGGYPRCQYLTDLVKDKRFSNRKLSQIYLNVEDLIKKLPNSLKINLDKLCKEELALIGSWYWYAQYNDRNFLKKKYHIDKEYDDFWYYRKFYHLELPPYTRMRYLDFMTYLNGDILTKVDRASMQASLEARVPFLDKEMVEFAFSLTQEECNPKGELKGLLKYSYKDIIPPKLFDRRKQGFSIPYKYINKENNPPKTIIEELWKL